MAALAVVAAAAAGCGGTPPGDEESRRVVIAALTAMRDGDADRVCRFLDRAERQGATNLHGSCVAAYRKIGPTGGQTPPSALQPGPVVDTEVEGDAREVTVRAKGAYRDVSFDVHEEDGRLVIGFDN